MAEEFKVSLGIQLNDGQLQNVRNQLNNIQTNPIKLKIDANDVKAELNSIKRQIQNLSGIKINLTGGTGSGNGIRNTVNDMNWAYRQMLDIQKKASSLSIKMNGLDATNNINELRELSLQFATLRSDYETLKKVFGSNLSTTQWGNLQAVITETDSKLSLLDAKATDVKAKLASDISLKLNTNTFNNDISTLEANFNKLKVKTTEVTTGMADVRNALNDMNIASRSGDVDGLISSYERYKTVLKDVQNQISINARAEKEVADAQKLLNDKTNLSLKMDVWLKNNSVATKQFGGAIRQLQSELKSCDATRLSGIKSEFQQITRQAELAGKATQTLGDKFKTQFSKLSTYLSASMVIMQTIRALKDMYNEVVKIDTALTELKKVTNEADASYEKFLSDSGKTAKEIGSTIDGLVSSTADFARLGYSFEESQELAKVANIYAVVGDEVEGVDGATRSLVSTMAAFNDETDAMSIIDKFNEVGNNFAISSGGIGEALTRSASSMKAAGNTLDETIALVTAANTVVQDPDIVGTAFKTISMRIRGAKTELEEAGLETDGMVESTAKLREEIMALSGVDIMLDDNTFKSTYQILQELSNKWQDLTDIQQASITELIAGKRQGNIISSLMNNFGIAEAALKTSQESAGSAMAEHSKWMESLDARLQKLQASWQSLSQSFLSSDFLKVLIDSLTTFVNILDGAINTFGTLGTITGGLAIFQLFKNRSYFSTLISSLKESEMSFSNFGAAAKMAGSDLKSFLKTPTGVATAIGLVTTAIGMVVQAYKNWEAEQEQLRAKTLDTNNSILDSVDTFEQVYVKYSGRTDLTADEENELTSAINGTITALGDKSNAIQGVIDKNNDYIASLENVAQEEIKEAQRRAKENLDTAKDQLQADSWDIWSGSEVTIDLSGRTGVKEFVEAKSVLEDLMSDYIDEGTHGLELEPLNWDSDHTDMDALIDYYYKLVDVKDTLIDQNLMDNDIYNNVKSTIDSLSGSVEEYLTQQYNVEKYNYELKNGIPKTIEQYEAMREAILGNVNASESYQNAIAGMMDEEWGQIFDLSSLNNSVNEAVNALSVAENLNISLPDLFGESSKFESTVDTYIEKVNKLKDALVDYQTGDFSNDDLTKLLKDFPELSNETDNLDRAIVNLLGNLNNDMLDGFSNQFGNLKTEEDIQALQNFQEAVLELGSVVGNTQMSIDIEAESTGMENLFTAMKESVSSTGLTSESIKNLKERYQDLESYDVARLFEKTANGVHLNTKALRELESAYEKQKKNEIDTDLQGLVNEYNSLTEQINGCSDAAKTAELYAKRAEITDQIDDTATLAAQYEGLTSAFYKWEQAQSIGEEGDMYDSLSGGLKDIKKLYDEGLIGTNKFRTAVQLMSNEDLSTASIDELLSAYESGYSTMKRYFTDSSDGCLNFLNDVQNLNSEWAKMNDDGSWEINFGVGNDQEIADALGINVESVQSILRKLSDYGFDINLDSIYSSLDLLQSEAEKANDKLKELGATDYTFNFNTDDVDYLNEQIEEAKTTLDKFKEDGTVNLSLEGATEAQTILIALISQKQTLSSPSVMNVDTTQAEGDIGDVIALLQDYQRNYNNLEIETAVGADTTEAQTNIQNVLSSINEMPDEIKTDLGLNDDKFQEALKTLTSTEVDVGAGVNLDQTSLEIVKSTIQNIKPEMMVKAGLDPSLIDAYEPEDEEATVKYIVDDREVDEYKAPNKTAKVIYTAKINDWTVPTRYGTIYYNSKVVGGVDGTAHSRGTAFAKGSWGTKESGVALGGELGQELVVRNGRFFTIGDKSAEFFRYQKGDIIFNAEQTREIFEKGKITHGSGRGKALVNGNAFIEGTAFSDGSGKITASGSVKTTASGSGKSNSSSNNNNSSSDEFKETFDLIEIAIDRIERAISKLDLKANSIYKSWSDRNKNLKKEIEEVESEISLQQKAYDRYIQQANSVGLSSDWAEKVRNGKVDIETITDESLAEKINEYQEWYEKAIDCKDAIEELKETEAELYEQAFDNVMTKYDGILEEFDYEKSMLEEYISQSEEKGYITSVKYYEALMNTERSNVKKLQQEKADLLASLQDGLASGTITKGSEAWQNMVNEINSVTLSIEEANTSMLEYSNSIRDIKWEIFDLMQEKISNITSEADFLIDLMSNDKLYDDRGQLTNEGMATMGLHGQNYNVYMEQANKYADEIKRINEELANDPYNKDLMERKQDLIELQQESVIAAEDEKQAIIDMVEEGIQLELDSLQELIDKYTEALDSQKDLYDYQKKVSEQTKEIASLQKQLSAYAGDTSEETKAKIQELKVSLEEAQSNLEETEYDKYISDQKQLLDSLYLEYETILNQRLDNVDALLEDMITGINNNASTISEVLKTEASNVGVTLSTEMQSIWNGDSDNMKSVLTTYGTGITNAVTTVNTTLGTINTNLQNMITQLNKIAGTNVESVGTQNASNSKEANTKPTPKPTTTTTPTTTSTPTTDSNTQSNDFFIKKKTYYPKNKLNTNTSIVDRLAYHDFDSSFSARKIYYGKMGFSGTYTSSASQNINMLNWMKNNGYRNGAYRLSKDELAWTQEGRNMEAIIRPSDGAILTPLAKDDSVLKASATSNIFNFANDPSGFIRDSLGINSVHSTPISQNIGGDTYTGDISLQIELPNVMNYEQFKYAMQHDKNFEKMVRAMTVDKMFGKSSLRKYNC